MTKRRFQTGPDSQGLRQQRALARVASTRSEGVQAPVRELALRVHYTPSHLRALYRAVFGESLAKARRRQRLDAAAARLIRGQYRITLLAREAGYASVEAFNHAFRARFGVAPSEFVALPGLASRAAPAIGIGLSLARHFGVERGGADHG